MSFSGILRRVAIVRTNVLKERISSIIRLTRIGKLGKTLAVTNERLQANANVFPNLPILVNLMMEAIRSSKTLVLTRTKRRKIPEDDILRVF
jgi:hypothetical protein